MRSAGEATRNLTELKQTLQFIEVSPATWRKATCGATPNVLVRSRGPNHSARRAEIKNLNSFRFLKEAVDYEIARQVALIESGARVTQETRLYDPYGRDRRHAHKEHGARLPLFFRNRTSCRSTVSEAWLAEIGAARRKLPPQAHALHPRTRACRV